MDNWNALGMKVPVILLPVAPTDMNAWSVIACDQYTSQPDYWTAVEKFVGEKPSTLHLMLPEIYLESADLQERIERVWQSMQQYQDNQILQPIQDGSVILERVVDGKSRKGLMMSLDLERYDYSPDSQSLIRATEGTIVERIPPRLQIREKASLELPHILVLIDDPKHEMIEPLWQEKGKLLYDTDLMEKGGHVSGYQIGQEALDAFAQRMEAKCTQLGENPLLFAVGDGNHSLATAKAHWENVKKTLSQQEQENHPARFALVELENVHDAGIEFEAIHRVLFHTEDTALDGIIEEMKAQNPNASIEYADGITLTCDDAQCIAYQRGKEQKTILVRGAEHQLAVGTLQKAIDAYMKKAKGVTIDFIHGADVVEELSQKPGTLGFLLPSMQKKDLFVSVQKDGPLPRKTFSMGEANEKRYYMECRRIVSK